MAKNNSKNKGGNSRKLRLHGAGASKAACSASHRDCIAVSALMAAFRYATLFLHFMQFILGLKAKNQPVFTSYNELFPESFKKH